MKGVLIFAGTTEGRKLTEFLGSHGVEVHSCVVTKYGKALLSESDNVKVSSDRLGMDGMCDLMKKYPLVIDATHPYAVTVTEHIKEACARTGAEYIRLLRPEGRHCGDLKVVDTIDEAVEYLKNTEGNILATTGSKEVAKYADLRDRTYVRVLPNADSLEKCISAGFEGKHIICMQGPFDEELNYGMLRQTDARFMVTKDSGQPGGFGEKISAASRAGAEVILIGRPVKETGMSFDDVVGMLRERYGIEDTCECKEDDRRSFAVIGIGMGTPQGLTVEARDTIASADLVVGAKRMVESVGMVGSDILEEYAADKILAYVKEHPEYRSIAVLVSGDVGFYSAAKKLIDSVDRDEFDLKVVCGISSLVYFCSKLGTTWQDVHPVSAHGRSLNIIGEVKRHPKVFSLLNGTEGARSLCSVLIEYGFDSVNITIGQDLGNPGEKIISGHPSEIMDKIDSKLCVALIENPNYSTVNPISIQDDELIRGDAPMTKSEVRALSVAKLKLGDDSVVYDVGAGTGSVSVEMALVAVGGTIYAVEKEEEAVELIKKNKKKFAVPNLEIVPGYAPEALKDLPAPTHVFVGGSAGNLKQILECVLEKNPSARFVVNSVTIETMAETMECIRALDLVEEDIACVNVSKGRKAGRYHLMTAQNPVYIVTCRGKGN